MPKQNTSATQIIEGVTFPAKWPMYLCQLWLFQFSPKLQVDPFWRPEGTLDGNPSPQPYTGTGRFMHAQAFIRLTLRKFEWHEWSTKAIQAFSENQETAICGAGGSGKSASAGAYAFPFYGCAPNDTAVLVASTTIAAALQRIWANIAANFSEITRATGGFGSSVMIGKPKPEIRASQKDFSHGMFVIPVAQGDLQKAIDELKGRHPKRILVIGDETDSISQAIVDVCANLRIGALEFQAIWLGNLPSSFNPLGKLMEPAPGKGVSEECGMEWISTSGVKCLRLDGQDSPNLKDNNKWSGLIRQEDIDAIARRNGPNSPQFWIMVRGLPPKEGVEDTVLSESILSRFLCYDKVTWKSSFISSAGLDPAFGGDRCVFRQFDRGLDTDNNLKILFHEPIPLNINAGDKLNPAEFQIAAQVQSLCKARAIPPNEFILDATGTGRGTAAVLQREWSPAINTCEFGGAPSDMAVSDENPIPASEQYDRKVTELWFSFREFVQAGMIRGLDSSTAREFCSRRFEVRAKKTRIEKKEDMKARGLPSPDNADCVALAIDFLRLKGIQASIQTKVKQESNSALEKELEEQDFDASELVYSDDFV